MERITYRITLDAYKNGIQRTLQGFETADNMARRIAINLTAGGDTYEIPSDYVVAMMYVTTPSATEPSINECTIEDNTIIYDVLPIVEEGITEMQLKLIETSANGARKVLVSPKFAVEVTESGTNDDSAEQSAAFTALENATAKAMAVYDSRLLRVEIADDCTFKAFYADGTVYENNYLHEALYNGNALLSESWAKGGTGIRDGEDVNNAMYFSNVSRSASADVNMIAGESRELLDEARLKTAFTAFNVNFDTGNLDYASANYTFDVNEETGDLEAESDGSYAPEQVIGDVVNDYLNEKTASQDQKIDDVVSEIGTADISAIGDGTVKGAIKEHDSKFLPLTGGTLSGDLTIQKFNNGKALFQKSHSETVDYGAYMCDFDSSGKEANINVRASINDTKNMVRFTYDKKDGNVKSYNLFGEHNKDLMAESFLPLTGGTITTDGIGLRILRPNTTNKDRIMLEIGSTGRTYFLASTDGELEQRGYVVREVTNEIKDMFATYHYVNNSQYFYNLFGEHNKPSGSYMGNGSATKRTVDIGGIGDFLLISASNTISIVSEYGCVSFNTGSSVMGCLNVTEVNFGNGVLTIATDNAGINYSGVPYKYQVV